MPGETLFLGLLARRPGPAIWMLASCAALVGAGILISTALPEARPYTDPIDGQATDGSLFFLVRGPADVEARERTISGLVGFPVQAPDAAALGLYPAVFGRLAPDPAAPFWRNTRATVDYVPSEGIGGKGSDALPVFRLIFHGRELDPPSTAVELPAPTGYRLFTTPPSSPDRPTRYLLAGPGRSFELLAYAAPSGGSRLLEADALGLLRMLVP